MALRSALIALARRVTRRPTRDVPEVLSAVVARAADAHPRAVPSPDAPQLQRALVVDAPLEVAEVVPGSLLLDIREPGELAGGVAAEALLLPMNAVPHHLDALDRARPITVYCAAGARSLGVAHWLREQGYNAVSLEGGISSLRWGASPTPMRVPDRAGERVTLPTGATVDGVGVGATTAERVDGDRVRVLDATGLELVGHLALR